MNQETNVLPFTSQSDASVQQDPYMNYYSGLIESYGSTPSSSLNSHIHPSTIPTSHPYPQFTSAEYSFQPLMYPTSMDPMHPSFDFSGTSAGSGVSPSPIPLPSSSSFSSNHARPLTSSLNLSYYQPMPLLFPSTMGTTSTTPTLQPMYLPMSDPLKTPSESKLTSPNSQRKRSVQEEDTELTPTQKQRQLLTPEQKAALKRVYSESYFPDQDVKAELCRSLNIPMKRIHIWFQNQRQYHRLKNKKRASQQFSSPPFNSSYFVHRLSL
ncbi:hypothetical protein HMI54_001783 [Coelomomyces lativittatus]|nr:hypothetical protein HMI56_007699 [Coelomomyces lativittatus]KAJ1510214.1 hypothetical protein HMI54_001783 [Coelomomyces lativittatus]